MSKQCRTLNFSFSEISLKMPSISFLFVMLSENKFNLRYIRGMSTSKYRNTSRKHKNENVQTRTILRKVETIKYEHTNNLKLDPFFSASVCQQRERSHRRTLSHARVCARAHLRDAIIVNARCVHRPLEALFDLLPAQLAQ